MRRWRAACMPGQAQTTTDRRRHQQSATRGAGGRAVFEWRARCSARTTTRGRGRHHVASRVPRVARGSLLQLRGAATEGVCRASHVGSSLTSSSSWQRQRRVDDVELRRDGTDCHPRWRGGCASSRSLRRLLRVVAAAAVTAGVAAVAADSSGGVRTGLAGGRGAHATRARWHAATRAGRAAGDTMRS